MYVRRLSFLAPTRRPPMIYRTTADAILILHLCFVVFVLVGGFAALRWPRLGRLHVPAALWGILIEYAGWICPLTPLEVTLRRRGGWLAMAGFIEHSSHCRLVSRRTDPWHPVASRLLCAARQPCRLCLPFCPMACAHLKLPPQRALCNTARRSARTERDVEYHRHEAAHRRQRHQVGAPALVREGISS